MSSVTIAPSSDTNTPAKPRGRSQTVVKMILTNRWTSVYAAAFLPIIVSAVLVLIALLWMKVNGWTTEVFIPFFESSLVMPAVLTLVLAVAMYTFITGNFRLIMGMGFTRGNIWWAVLKVAVLNALISTVVISIFSALEVATHGYGINWYVFSVDLDILRFYLHGGGYGPTSSAVEFARFTSHYFLILLTIQLAAALVAVVRLRWGLLIAGATFLVIVLLALHFSRSAFGTISWDLGISNLYYPYTTMYDAANNTYTVKLNSGPLPIEEIQQSIDDRGTPTLPLTFIIHEIAFSTAKILAFAAVLYGAGAAVLKKMDLR